MFLIQLNTKNFTGLHLDFNQSNHHGEKKNISNKTSNLGGQVNSRKSGKTPATRSRLPSLLSNLIGLECDACHSAVSFTLDSKSDKIDTIEFKFFFFRISFENCSIDAARPYLYTCHSSSYSLCSSTIFCPHTCIVLVKPKLGTLRLYLYNLKQENRDYFH